MKLVFLALRNLARNRRRTAISLAVVAVGTAALLLTAGFVEFSFDVVQVAAGAYAPEAYHRYIGFKVAKPALERALASNRTVVIDVKTERAAPTPIEPAKSTRICCPPVAAQSPYQM